MQTYRLTFVSILNEKVASHRFRVSKLVPLLQSASTSVAVIRFHPRLEFVGMLRLAVDLLRHRRIPRIVVFQKTISFGLAWVARTLGAKLIMDMDDGSLQRIDGSYYPRDHLRRLERWAHLMDAMVVSCEALREWLQWTQSKTYIIPTCLDVDSYEALSNNRTDSRCVIGWVGSPPSRVFLAPIEQSLTAMVQRYNCGVLVVGRDDPQLSPDIRAQFVPWYPELEPGVFGQISIGIMPLPDNERARMKAGFKLLQYMAAGLPVVASPIGVNKEIVRPGWNGFLANTVEEWETYLGQLASDSNLRLAMGKNGQGFVKEHYRLEIAATLWQNVCEDILASSSWS